MKTQNSSVMWLEYILIIVLVVILAIAAYKLFGPYLTQEISDLCIEFGLPCGDGGL
jgi:hypothetical protein